MTESPAENRAAPRAGLFPRAVVLLSLASFFNDISSEVLLKALPLYLREVLGAPMVIVGLIDGLADATATLLQLGVGWWSDKVGRRKPFVLAGYALSNLTKPLLYFAAAWWHVLAFRVTDRVGKGLRSAPRDALIAEVTPPEQRGRAFGLHHALDPAGAMVSLLVGAWILSYSQASDAPLEVASFRNLVLFIIIPGLITLLLVAAVYEPRAVERVTTRRIGRPVGLGAAYWRFLVLVVIFTLGNSSDAFLVIRTRELGAGLPQLLLVLAGFNLMTVIFSLPTGWLSDRFGRKRFLALGWVLYAGVYAGFGFVEDNRQALVLLLLYGAYYGLTEGVSKAFVADLVPPERRATAYGMLSAAQGLCVLPASLLAGWLWTAVSKPTPFLVGGALALIAATGLLIVRKPEVSSDAGG